MITAPPTTALRPASHAAASSAAPAAAWRTYLGVGLAAFASALAVAIGIQTLVAGPPGSCGSDCVATLAQSPYAVVLGVPALAWASALHAVLFALVWAGVLAPRLRHGLLYAAQLGLVAVLLAGSATYLVIGLATDVRCSICLAMHALAVLAALGVAVTPRHPDTASLSQRLAAVTLALAAWGLVAWGLAQVAARARTARAAPAAVADKWLAAVCRPDTCPAAARFGPEALPDDASSLVLSRGPGPTLVAWLDLECPACRADFRAEEPLFRRLVHEGRGLRLLFRAAARACDARATHDDPARCQAPAAIVCAARHGGADAALDLLQHELSAEPGYYTLADRRRALMRLSPLAARCLDSELALGPRGTLAAHAEAARRLAAHAASHAGCAAADEADAPWWCFMATPSFAIVDSTSQSPTTSADTAFSTATGELRRDVLEQCMEAP